MSDRKETCPAHLNLEEGGNQPLWERCYLFFATCPHFEKKKECWNEWDKQTAKRKEKDEAKNSKKVSNKKQA